MGQFNKYINVGRKALGQIGDRLMRLLTTLTLLTICLTALGQTFDTESKYTDATGKSVIIQNSLPKGGAYLDSAGNIIRNTKNFAYVIFWTRVINETATPLELTINFPADFPSPYSYLKLFLPPDTMTIDKESLYNYGVTGLTGFNKPTKLQRTINPKEECSFYIAAVSFRAGGTVRAGLILKEHDLFYSIRGIAPELDSVLIPCGQIVFKKLKR